MVFPNEVRIREVCPRDGFQAEARFIETNKKIDIIDRLSDCGYSEIQYTAFVHPKAIPNLKDAEEVSKRIKHVKGVTYSALIANKRGLYRAIEAGVEKVEYVISASDSHNLNNVNATTKESLKSLEEIIKESPNCKITPGTAVAFGCPFEGNIPFERIKWLIQSYVDMGITEVCIADTIGVANPIQVFNTISNLLELFPELEIALHLHNTRGLALANIYAGVQAGAKIIDSAVGGLGGCPFAPGATGNVSTEDVVHMFDLMGVKTGVDLDRVIDVAKIIEKEVGHADSYVLRAGKAQDLISEKK